MRQSRLLNIAVQVQRFYHPTTVNTTSKSLLSTHRIQTQGIPRARWFSSTMAQNKERTFIAVKPDGVQRGIIGDIIKRFEQKGFKLVAMKMIQADNNLLQQHYSELKEKPFFPALVKYMSSGPVVAMVWEGLNAVKTGRVMLGETNPFNSKPGTIRGDFCIQVGRNICHGSDSVETAKREISLWFKDAEISEYESCAQKWVYEDA